MIRSQSEIEAQALKAARGAGMPLGLAEDFARAVRVLAATDSAALGTVAAALTGPFAANAGRVAVEAPAAIDAVRSDDRPQPLVVRDAPALVAAYLRRANADFGLALRWDNDRVVLTGGASDLPGGPVEVPDDIWADWDHHAQATYVPATAESRAGAGAGLTDND